jgi:rRNA-processing protein EBP2
MRILTEGIKMTHTPWPEHLIVSSKTIIDVDPSNDLQRETAFYKLALEAVPFARAQCAKHDIPFSRPNDYYAEMVKSDEHMERVRTKLVEESQGIKKSEEAKKQRELKKYGKQIQHEKLKQRDADKKNFNDKMAGVKRKRKEGMEIGDEGDDFGVELDHEDDGARGRGGARGGKGGDRKPKVSSRVARAQQHKIKELTGTDAPHSPRRKVLARRLVPPRQAEHAREHQRRFRLGRQEGRQVWRQGRTGWQGRKAYWRCREAG